jgi:hypothetical protein
VRVHIAPEACGHQQVAPINLGELHGIPGAIKFAAAEFECGEATALETACVQFLKRWQVVAALLNEQAFGLLSMAVPK